MAVVPTCSRRQRLDAEPKLNPWRRLPGRYRVLLIALLLGVAGASCWSHLSEFLFDLLPKTATIRLVDQDDKTITLAGRADVFEVDRTKFLSSPRPLLGSIKLDDLGEVIVVDSDRFPKSLQIRFHVPGYGVDYASVELGQRREHRLRLGPPASVKGVVIGKHGAPVAGARVIILGVDPRGVIIAESESDQLGHYQLHNISRRAGIMVLRILQPGYAIEEREHSLVEFAIPRLRDTRFVLTPVPPVLGQLRIPVGCVTSGLQLSVMHLPGVVAEVADDGAFTLHHLPAGRRYRLLVRGLPDGFAHPETYVEPGQRVEIEIGSVVAVQGRVVSRRTGRSVAGARIWHSYSTCGNEAVRTDAFGEFRLCSVPSGSHWITVEMPESPDFPSGGVESHKILAAAAAELEITVR